MKVAVVGSRDAKNVTEKFIFENLPDNCTHVISGGAAGIDTLAKNMAQHYQLEYSEILPDYTSYGKSAPIIRNLKIIEDADFVIAFWDHRSPGTQQVISECVKRCKPFKIVSV